MSLETPDPTDLLRRYFGHSEFRGGQKAVIDALLSGDSAAAVFPTGGGKSLCYQLPALAFDGLTLVVSPLIALMKDQIDALTARGIRAGRLDSSLSLDEYRQIMDDVRNHNMRLLYVAPERFNNERFRASLSTVEISLFAVDEAHCISEWGHNFRPDYLKLVEFARACNAKRMLALTATATTEVLQDICRQFAIKPAHAINTGFYRANLNLRTTAVEPSERDQVLVQQIKSKPLKSAIVYVTLQKTAEHVAKVLQSNGLAARHYHAGLKSEQRAEIQDWFVQSDSNIVVATIAFGMGIDKSNIRGVYHYNLPKSLENYSQEIGRAGRDGEAALCQLLACTDDLIPLENFIYGDTPTTGAVTRFVDTIFSEENEFDISLYDLSHQCDVRPLVLRTLLTRLELKGYLRGGTPFYANYQFKPLQSSKDILARFDGERRQFIGNLFRQAVKNKTWYQIDLEQSVAALASPRDRIVRALDYLSEQNLLEVKVAGVRNRYTIIKRPETREHLAAELSKENAEREKSEIDRLQQTISWITLDACQTSALADRFGEALNTDCGHCSWCETGRAVVLGGRPETVLTAQLREQIAELKAEHSQVLESPVEVARVLCGLSSPRISKAKLQKHPLFGQCERVAYESVLEGAQLCF
ncbi:helicase [Chromatiales bacterium (ex Bugula neritina AB1)]|nr:helicase [Chromatiales bacterium (ex Bugula neritina AB1)]